MRVLIFGASGYIGRRICLRFCEEGHQVTAFVRDGGGGERAREAGAHPVIGDLADPAGLHAIVEEHDAVVWLAQVMLDEEHRIVQAILAALRNSGKPFIFTSGTSLLSVRTDGEWLEESCSEYDAFVPRRHIAGRLAIENMVREAATGDVRAMCIRPPLIWGHGGSKAISDLYHSAAKTGAVCYVGRGLNVYSHAHVDDLAELYGLALLRGVGGALYHCVSGEANFRSMAEAVAGRLGVSTRSIAVSEAVEIWDKFTGPIVFAGCSRTRAPRARAELGWRPSPSRSDILIECASPAYRADAERALPAHVATKG